VPLLITVGIIVFLVGGYYLYEQVFTKTSIKPWDVVPQDAVFVYEREGCDDCLAQVVESPVLKLVERAVFFGKPADSLKKTLTQLINDQIGLLISVHPTKKDDFDFVFYAPNAANKSGLILKLANRKYFKFSEREFNSVKIQELKFSNQIFSWAVLDDVWVGSFTPFLIEDVIRTHNSRRQTGFRNQVADVTKLSGIKDDAGNFYVHLKNLSEWFSLFSTSQADLIKSLGKSSRLDLKATDNTLVLNGFSTDSADRSAFVLSAFYQQSPVPFSLKNHVSTNVMALTSYGVSDGVSFYKDLQNFVNKRSPHLRDTLQTLAASASVNLDELYGSISDEIGVCFLEAAKGKKLTQVLMVESNKPEHWQRAFQALASKLSIDTIFYERYSDYEIREVPVHKFPEKLFWPLVSGFEKCFYTSSGNLIFIAEDLEELKSFLNDIDREDTWGKSVAQNKFLETTLLESNLSLYINMPRIWSVVGPKLHPRWRQFLQENRSLMGALQMGAVQFSRLSENYYTNISLAYTHPKAQQKEGPREKISTNFEVGIRKVYAVKSHVDKTNEILVQDSANNLSLVSSEGKILWKLQLPGSITSDVTQIDFFKNGKLQYFFSTSEALYIIDRLGNYVEPYPLQLAGVDVSDAGIIDYDHSKTYRFIVVNKNGKLWMYDKQGENLEGWRPNDVQGNLLTTPAHHRIKGKDYIICIRKDGVVYLMNRRGGNVKNFPLNLESRLEGEYFLELGGSLSDTYFVVISRDGYRIKFNLDGKVQSRETLVKTSVNPRFSLVKEASGKSYLILQQEPKQLSLMDESGKKILANEFIGQNPVEVQYHDFGAGKTYIVITDKTQELSFVYDGQGTPLIATPLESNSITIRQNDADGIKTYTAYQKALIIQPH
ncbi:MAG: hypothetical protein ACOYXT_25835, partial [Bacteroidota bacterium]